MKYIFLHGMGQTSADWDDALSAAGHTDDILVPDLKAFIGNDGYVDMFKNFTEYCDAFHDKLCLCGLSLGAVLSLEYAVNFPGRTEQLILIAPQYKSPKTLLKLQNAVFGLLPEKSFCSAGLSKETFISILRSMEDIDLSGMLDKVTCPALVVCGEKDHANRKAALSLAGMLPRGESCIILGCGHEVNTEKSGLTGRIIAKRFFRGGVHR